MISRPHHQQVPRQTTRCSSTLAKTSALVTIRTQTSLVRPRSLIKQTNQKLCKSLTHFSAVIYGLKEKIRVEVAFFRTTLPSPRSFTTQFFASRRVTLFSSTWTRNWSSIQFTSRIQSWTPMTISTTGHSPILPIWSTDRTSLWTLFRIYSKIRASLCSKTRHPKPCPSSQSYPPDKSAQTP